MAAVNKEDLLSEEMLNLERALDDELSPLEDDRYPMDSGDVKIIFPH